MEEQKHSSKAKSSKKRLYGTAAVIIIAIIIAASIVYYWQSRTNFVRITKFIKSGGGQTPDEMIYGFDLKVANQGINDVNNLNLAVRVLGNGNELGRWTDYPFNLRSGQEVDQSYGISVGMNATFGQVISYVATIELNGTILDEARIT